MDRYGSGGNGSPAVTRRWRSGRRGWAVAIACLLGLLALAPLAESRIVVQRGIAGINLNMTRARVIQNKGQPDSQRIVSNEILGQVRIMRYGRTRVSFNGTRNDSRAISVDTRSRRQRTRSGVGVGSTENQVKNRIQGVQCRTESGTRHCFKGQFAAGERVTDFRIRQGRVSRVTVAFVID